MRHTDYKRAAGYVGAPMQRQRAQDAARFAGTKPYLCGPVKRFSAEERAAFEASLKGKGEKA